MARKLAACGTYAAARRHERRGETIDPACAEALRAYRAERQAARRAEMPHVVARAHRTLTEIPDGWTLWEGVMWDDRPLYGYTPPEDTEVTPTGVHLTTITVTSDVTLRDLVRDWHADVPGTADRIMLLDDTDRHAVLWTLGYGSGPVDQHHDLARSVTVSDHTTVEWTAPSDVAAAEAAIIASWPWPTPEISRDTVDQVEWIDEPPAQGPVLRAAHGTPLPDGWTLCDGGWRAERMPLAWTIERAIADWEDAHDSARTTVVIHPTSGEVWCGIGSHAQSLGVYTDRDVMTAQILDQIDVPSVRRWSDTPMVNVYTATSPGWAALGEPTVVPLDGFQI